MKTRRRPAVTGWRALLSVPALGSANAFAEVTEITGNALFDGIASTLIYGSIGISMAAVGFKVVDWLTPGSLRQQIAEDENRALAILAGATMLGVCIIIAAVLVG